jgi:hypothetical protein
MKYIFDEDSKLIHILTDDNQLVIRLSRELIHEITYFHRGLDVAIELTKAIASGMSSNIIESELKPVCDDLITKFGYIENLLNNE